MWAEPVRHSKSLKANVEKQRGRSRQRKTGHKEAEPRGHSVCGAGRVSPGGVVLGRTAGLAPPGATEAAIGRELYRS